MMNKQEAIALMKQGVKITHRLFTRDEWIRDETLVNGNSRIIDEQGLNHTYDEFFLFRRSRSWDDGYSVWEPREKPMTATEVMESEKEQVNKARELHYSLTQHMLKPLLDECERRISGFGVPQHLTGIDLVTEDTLILGTGMVEVDTISGEVTHIGQEQIRPEADEWTQVEDELPEMFDQYDFTGDDIMVSSVVVTNRGAAALLDGEWVVASWDVSEACKRLEGVTRWKPIHYSGEGES